MLFIAERQKNEPHKSFLIVFDKGSKRVRKRVSAIRFKPSGLAARITRKEAAPTQRIFEMNTVGIQPSAFTVDAIPQATNLLGPRFG